MRVLIINTSERIGGAAVAAGRLMESLKNNGIKAKMLVRDKQTDQISVVGLKRSWLHVWKFMWERIVIWKANRFKKNDLFAVDIANTGTDITSLPEFQQADVIHLHWINQGMLSLNTIRKILTSGKPVVWTMHDMWPCTGICHYARECRNYEQECHHCPYIYGGGGKKDLSTRIFRKKKEIYSQAPITFVGCSRWLAEKAKVSGLLTGQTVINIPNAINTNLYKPHNKQEARRKCRLPQEGKLILFGSVKITDKRKGIDYLIEACKLLAEKHPEWKDSLGVVVFGNQSQQLQDLIPFRVYPLPYIKNEHELVDIYNAVDLFAIPSLEEKPAEYGHGSHVLRCALCRLQHRRHTGNDRSSAQRICSSAQVGRRPGQRHPLDIDGARICGTLRTSLPQSHRQLFGKYHSQEVHGRL